MSRNISQARERYKDAVNLLNGQRRPLRPRSPSKFEGNAIKMPGSPSFQGKPGLSNMNHWLSSLGYSEPRINDLNVIHVAGTKGKGSTCAFTRSFLQAHGERTGFPKKIGLYTSPHIKVIRDRIQIGSQPIDEERFAEYLFEVWDNLSSPQPRFQQLLLLLAVHTFFKEKVDIAIIETHVGGEYDSTNVFTKPVACGIATIGMDHVEQLGPNIDNIAWHKAGILKKNVPAFSVRQEPVAAQIIQDRASERQTCVTFTEDEKFDNYKEFPAMNTAVQRKNAALAVELANSFLQQNNALLTESDIIRGISGFSWDGRFQQVVDGKHLWFLDGAHNELSIPYAVQWFIETVPRDQTPKVLIFSHISTRDGAKMLGLAARNFQQQAFPIDHLILSTYKERLDGNPDGPLEHSTPAFPTDLQQEYIKAWKVHQPRAQISIEPSIEGALHRARSSDNGQGMSCLITGSLYLVGGALRLLEPGI